MLCPFYRTTVLSSPLEPMTSPTYTSDQVYGTIHAFSSVEQDSNVIREEIFAPMAVCHCSKEYKSSLRVSQLDKPTRNFSSPVACAVSSGTLKTGKHGGIFKFFSLCFPTKIGDVFTHMFLTSSSGLGLPKAWQLFLYSKSEFIPVMVFVILTHLEFIF